MKTSAAGIDLIKRFEGFRPHPYRDAVGVWTIGYGETKGVGPNTAPVSEAQASAQLKARVDRDYAPSVDRLGVVLNQRLRVALNQNQFDALVSAVYNLGPGVLDRGRSLGDALLSGNLRAAADALLLYDKAGGRALPGLTRRRREERALFLRPVGADAAQVAQWRHDLKATTTRIAKLRARARRLRKRLKRSG